MASAPLLIPVGYQFFSNAGAPLAGGFLYTYAAGSTTPQSTFSDNGLSVLNPNPIPLNSAGRCAVSGIEVNVYPTSANYKLVLTDSTGTTVWTHDFVDPAAGWDLLTNATIVSPTIVSPTIVSPTITTSISGLLAQVCQGRLTLTSGAPVTTGDVSGATSIFFTPYTGNLLGLFDGLSTWTALPFAELTLNLGTLTSGLPYDVFAFNNNGAVALRSPVAWTNTTTRATALVLQNGIYVKTGATTDRYLGTFYTTSTTQTEDSASKRYLWNYYHRVRRRLLRQETTASWNYSTHTIRQANGNAANQVELVTGVAESPFHLDLRAMMADTANDTHTIGIGEDSTTTVDTANGVGGIVATGVANVMFNTTFVLDKIPTVGRHFYAWLEGTTNAGTTTWFGTDNDFAVIKSGLLGWVDG